MVAPQVQRSNYVVDWAFSDRYDKHEDALVEASLQPVRVLAAGRPVGLTRQDVHGLIVWGAVLLGAILLLAVVAYVLRSRARRREAAGPTFSLQKLRELRERGELTEAEFLRLRSRTAAEARAGAGRRHG